MWQRTQSLMSRRPVSPWAASGSWHWLHVASVILFQVLVTAWPSGRKSYSTSFTYVLLITIGSVRLMMRVA
ncbi:MAG: hypothetical protein B7Z61_04100 [Acidobacteria bacterium 37-71-11]|nr:MAG: hypothetical protein B7Z61_04100 [Acidobacteria bacterium 37-71-11]